MMAVNARRVEVLVDLRDDGRGRSGLAPREGGFALVRLPVTSRGLAVLAARWACRSLGMRVVAAEPPVLARKHAPAHRRLPNGPRGAEIGTIHAYPLDDDAE